MGRCYTLIWSCSMQLTVDHACLIPCLQILMSIPEDRISRMQRRITHVWHRFAYTRGKVLNPTFKTYVRLWLLSAVVASISLSPHTC